MHTGHPRCVRSVWGSTQPERERERESVCEEGAAAVRRPATPAAIVRRGYAGVRLFYWRAYLFVS